MAPLRSDDRQSEQRPILTTRRIARTRCHEPRPRSERATPPASPPRSSIASSDVLRIGDPWIAGVRPGRTYNDTVREPVGRLNRSCSWGEGMRFRPDQVSGTLHVSVRRIDGRFPRFPLPVVTCQFSHANGGAVNALTRKARRASGATRGVAAGGSARASPGRMAVPRQRARRPGWRRGPRRGVRT
jgi:hypothetical protein